MTLEDGQRSKRMSRRGTPRSSPSPSSERPIGCRARGWRCRVSQAVRGLRRRSPLADSVAREVDRRRSNKPAVAAEGGSRTENGVSSRRPPGGPSCCRNVLASAGWPMTEARSTRFITELRSRVHRTLDDLMRTGQMTDALAGSPQIPCSNVAASRSHGPVWRAPASPPERGRESVHHKRRSS